MFACDRVCSSGEDPVRLTGRSNPHINQYSLTSVLYSRNPEFDPGSTQTQRCALSSSLAKIQDRVPSPLDAGTKTKTMPGHNAPGGVHENPLGILKSEYGIFPDCPGKINR